MKDIKEIFEDACKPYLVTQPEITFKEENGEIQIIKGEQKMLFQGGTREQLYIAVLESLIRNAFMLLENSEPK